MATGIDAAGLALAIFPVVISTVDWYSGRISGRDFKHLSESLKTNEKIFLNSIELLLRCIAPPREVKDFLDNLKGPQWKSESLEKKVKEHLGDEAESILDKMKDIYRTINKLGDKLPVRDSRVSVKFASNDTLKYRLAIKLPAILRSIVSRLSSSRSCTERSTMPVSRG